MGFDLSLYFYCFNSVFDPTLLIKKYQKPNIVPDELYYTNAFGVKIDVNFYLEALAGHQGAVEGLPIPANWHADFAEFGTVFRAIDLAQKSFTMIELGCGWGCWISIAGVVAKSISLKTKVIGVEASPRHYNFAKQNMETNKFLESEYKLYRGVAAASEGYALFPRDTDGKETWGLSPIFDFSGDDFAEYLSTGKYDKVEKISLQRIVSGFEKIDLLHIDIQGGELPLVQDCIDIISSKVAYLFIGTHSRKIEGDLIDLLVKNQWILEIERPAVLGLGTVPYVTYDGIQGWRNPRVVEASEFIDTTGTLTLIDDLGSMPPNEEYLATVQVRNESTNDWIGVGINPICVSYHWFDSNGESLVHDGLRTPFSKEKLSVKDEMQQNITILTPDKPGKYRLEITLVKEQVLWFRAPNFKTATLDVVVE